MKIIFKDLRGKGILDHMVIHGLTSACEEGLIHEVAEQYQSDGYLDVIVTVNGNEINLEDFVQHWESQVDKMIANQAKEMVKEQFSTLTEMVMDLEERVGTEIDKRLEDWEKEEK